MSHFITAIREPVDAALFDPKVNEDFGSKAIRQKDRESYIKKKDHLPFIPKPEIKNFDGKTVHLGERLKKLPPEKVAQMGVNVFSNLARKNFGGAVAAGVQGVVELWTGKSSRTEVASANVSAEHSESGLTAFLSNNELTKHFAFRLKRLAQAIRDYVDGQGSGSQLAWEFGKVGLIVGGALAALGISIATAGGFDGLLQAVSVSASVFSSLTSFSIPTFIQSLTATAPLACSFLSAAHVIADQLMRLDMEKEVKGGDIEALFKGITGKSGEKREALDAELEKMVEGEFLARRSSMGKNSLGDIARRAFLVTYNGYWRDMVRDDPAVARAVAAKVDRLLETDSALKQSACTVWEKLQCWHVLNRVVQTMPEEASGRIKALDGLNIPAAYENQLGRDEQLLPYNALMMQETLQEEVEKEIGVKLDRETGKVFSAVTGRQLALSRQGILERLRCYQKRVFLGGYLAEHYVPAREAFSGVWQKSEKRTRKLISQRSTEQVKSLADFLLRMTVGQVVIEKRGGSRLEKEPDSNHRLKVALANQLKLLQPAANTLTEANESAIKRKSSQRKQASNAQNELKGYDLGYGPLEEFVGSI